MDEDIKTLDDVLRVMKEIKEKYRKSKSEVNQEDVERQNKTS